MTPSLLSHYGTEFKFQPCDLCPLLFQSPTSRHADGLFVYVLHGCGRMCVTDLDTNEPTDYCGKPRVIISSPRIKHQIKPTAGWRDAGHKYIFVFPLGNVENPHTFQEGKKFTVRWWVVEAWFWSKSDGGIHNMPHHLCTNPDSCYWIPPQKSLVAPSVFSQTTGTGIPQEEHSLINSLEVL